MAGPGHPRRHVLHLGDHQGGADLPDPAGEAGYLTRRIGLRRKGRDWYENRFLPRIGPFALYGLLFTIVVMFALQGEGSSATRSRSSRIAIPLLV